MIWPPLEPLNLPGEQGRIIDRQLEEVRAFRQAVDGGVKKSGKFFRPEDAINEALRRELVIRVYAAKYAAECKLDLGPLTLAIEALRGMLNDRRGHRS
jgi:hypothetical protein